MEDAKPVLPSAADDGGAMESRFADLCKVCKVLSFLKHPFPFLLASFGII